ncbi:MAG: hypothetical protein ACXVFB_04065 [Gaiellaceae bacterium]
MATTALSHRARHPRPRPASLVALGARLHHRALDRDLARGIAAWRSPAHAARASQLTSRRHRRRLADALDHVLEATRLPPSCQARGVILPCRPSVRASAPQLIELAARLRSDEPVAAAGIVRLEVLLCDGAGPVYTPGHGDVLAGALSMAARWLDVEE